MSTIVASNLQASGGAGTAATLASINGGPLAGFRNRIINGNFDIWQRGTTHSSLGYGSVDRWANSFNGSACTISQQSFTVGQTDVPDNPRFFCRAAVTSAAGAGNYAILNQYIEDVRTFSGQTVTVSFWAKADASRPIAIELEQTFGTGGSASVGGIGTTKVTLSTTWQRISVTITVPSISGKSIGTANDTLNVLIWFDAGSNFNARTSSLGQQSGTFDIAQVQIEPGPVATPFERRSYGQELVLCQRYFESGSGVLLASFSGGSFGGGILNYQFKVTKRVAPTQVFVAGTGLGSVTTFQTTSFVDRFAVWWNGGALQQDYREFTFTSSAEL